jgi:hypothetical protein
MQLVQSQETEVSTQSDSDLSIHDIYPISSFLQDSSDTHTFLKLTVV